MHAHIPDFYDNLDASFEQAWLMLVRGGADRRSAFHTPVVASVDASGAPEARVMVLRQADRAARSLRFHTDIRTAKVAQLARQPAITVLGYDPGAKIQLRVRGVGNIIGDGAHADAAWARSALSSRKCYLAESAPGSGVEAATSGLPPAFETRDPDEAEALPGRANFSVLLVTVESLEWLYLAAPGHRRARFQWSDTEWTKHWLVP